MHGWRWAMVSNADCNIQQSKRNIIQWYSSWKSLQYTLVENTKYRWFVAIVGCTTIQRRQFSLPTNWSLTKTSVKIELNPLKTESIVTPLICLRMDQFWVSHQPLNAELGNHIEKAGLNGTNMPKSWFIHYFTKMLALKINDNEFVANGSRFNSDQQLIQQSVKWLMQGWDAINPDGTPRTTNAQYGSCNNLQGWTNGLSSKRNNFNAPTVTGSQIWTTVVVLNCQKQLNKTSFPNTFQHVTTTKTLCLLKKQIEKPKPQVPTTPTEPQL